MSLSLQFVTFSLISIHSTVFHDIHSRFHSIKHEHTTASTFRWLCFVDSFNQHSYHFLQHVKLINHASTHFIFAELSQFSFYIISRRILDTKLLSKACKWLLDTSSYQKWEQKKRVCTSWREMNASSFIENESSMYVSENTLVAKFQCDQISVVSCIDQAFIESWSRFIERFLEIHWILRIWHVKRSLRNRFNVECSIVNFILIFVATDAFAFVYLQAWWQSFISKHQKF